MADQSGWSMTFSSLYLDTIQETEISSPSQKELLLFLGVLWVKSRGEDYITPLFSLKQMVGLEDD